MREFFKQTDKRWKNNIMQYKGQTIGKYGCLVTTIANINQYIGKMRLNVAELNDYCNTNKLYYGGSYLRTDDLLFQLGMKRKKHAEYVDKPSYFYYIYYVYKGYKHFTNITHMDDTYAYVFNVYNGKRERIYIDDIMILYRVEKI